MAAFSIWLWGCLTTVIDILFGSGSHRLEVGLINFGCNCNQDLLSLSEIAISLDNQSICEFKKYLNWNLSLLLLKVNYKLAEVILHLKAW